MYSEVSLFMRVEFVWLDYFWGFVVGIEFKVLFMLSIWFVIELFFSVRYFLLVLFFSIDILVIRFLVYRFWEYIKL